MRPHGLFAHCSCKNARLTLDLGLSASAAGSCCIFTLAVRQPPVLASCIETYYFFTHACKILIYALFTDTDLPSISASRPRPRVRPAFSHSQCAKRPFWPLVSKYTIHKSVRKQYGNPDSHPSLFVYIRSSHADQLPETDSKSNASHRSRCQYVVTWQLCQRQI